MAQRVKKGTRLKTPSYSLLMKEYVNERIAEGERTLGEDWENFEDTPCDKCAGTGVSPDPDDKFCYGCEGTGIWYRMYYGVSDGQPYAYTDEWGVDFLKEVCKADREAFLELQLAGKVGNRSMIRPFRLCKTLEMELLARGYNPANRTGENIRAIANIVAREYPDFMSVPYKSF